MVATIKMWGKTVGAILWDTRWDVATIEIDPSFVKLGLDISPLAMPLHQLQKGELIYQFQELPKDGFHGLPGLLIDSLPGDFGNSLINAWIESRDKNPEEIDPVQRLLYTGRRGMGALEFEPTNHPTDNKSDIVFIEELADFALHALGEDKIKKRKKQNEGFKDVLRVCTSAGGSRAKALLAINDRTGEVRSGQTDAPDGFEHWIIKLDEVTNRKLGDPKGYGRIEYAYYLMARESGIQMMESTLLEENNRAHFLTQRFDRMGGNKKLHVQTLSALGHIQPGDPENASYEKAFEVMRILKLSHNAIEQLFTRMVFNIMSRNYNDHTLNTSFIMDEKGRWKLAPAYDMVYAYHPEHRLTHRMQMSVNGKYDEITFEDIQSIAKEVSIKRPKKIIDQVSQGISRWMEFSKHAGIPSPQANVIRKMHRLSIENE